LLLKEPTRPRGGGERLGEIIDLEPALIRSAEEMERKTACVEFAAPAAEDFHQMNLL
jgi:hypothetical protein